MSNFVEYNNTRKIIFYNVNVLLKNKLKDWKMVLDDLILNGMFVIDISFVGKPNWGTTLVDFIK